MRILVYDVSLLVRPVEPPALLGRALGRGRRGQAGALGLKDDKVFSSLYGDYMVILKTSYRGVPLERVIENTLLTVFTQQFELFN